MVRRAAGVTSYYARVQKVDLVGQAITALVITFGALVLGYNLVRWLCGF